ncbi:MAG TPA: response regulator [Thermoanaerobaculia bacterium]|nr:response regulator [Thermoanaerobaculia bacterium]
MHSILLVDDTGLFRAIGEILERRTQCRLLTAGNGTDALNVARREKPDLIVLDAEMSGMTGIDVCRVLKADSHCARTPIVVVSSSPTGEADARRAGANECLPKPLEEAAIFESVRKHLRLSPRDAARASVGWPVTFWRDGVQHNGNLRDLSLGGFFIRTPVRQPIGARVEVSFDVPGRKPGSTVVAEAIVVRVASEPDRGLGCRFFQMTAGPRARLEECLHMLDLEKETAAAGSSRKGGAKGP